jgi:hypothetical protein
MCVNQRFELLKYRSLQCICFRDSACSEHPSRPTRRPPNLPGHTPPASLVTGCHNPSRAPLAAEFSGLLAGLEAAEQVALARWRAGVWAAIRTQAARCRPTNTSRCRPGRPVISTGDGLQRDRHRPARISSRVGSVCDQNACGSALQPRSSAAKVARSIQRSRMVHGRQDAGAFCDKGGGPTPPHRLPEACSSPLLGDSHRVHAPGVRIDTPTSAANSPSAEKGLATGGPCSKMARSTRAGVWFRPRDWHHGDVTESDEPILALAREIRRHAERLVADDLGDPETFARLIAALPERERERMLLDTFQRLSPDTQWAIIEHAFGDDEIRAHLRAERDQRLALVTRNAARTDVVLAAQLAGRLETSTVAAGDELTVGLFRESQARAAVARGRHAANCARRVVLVHQGGGVYRVLEDVFNPYSGYFVTAEYDHRTWECERLDPHCLVTVGSADTTSPADFEPVLFRGGPVRRPGRRQDPCRQVARRVSPTGRDGCLRRMIQAHSVRGPDAG